MAKVNSNIAGLDLGTTHTRVLIASLNSERGRLETLGISSVVSKGIRKGVVVNIESAEDTIRQAISEAEQIAGVEVKQVNVGLSGVQVKSYNGQGMVTVSKRNHEITEADIKRVIDQASAISLPSDREIVEVLPQEFLVDEQDGIGDPLGMLGMKLGVNVHIVTSPITAKQNIVTSINRSSIIVSDLILESLAAAEAVLTEEEREYGVALVNIGGEVTSLAIYRRGSIRHTAVFQIGGNHFTNDIAIGVRTTIPEAEKIKCNLGCSFSPLLNEVERETGVEVMSIGGRNTRTLSRQLLCDILQPRAEEIFSQIQEEIHYSGYDRQLSSGLVLTGGGSLLNGISEVAEHLLDLPVRLGTPQGIQNTYVDLTSPEYATVVGLVLCGLKSKLLHKGHLYQGWHGNRFRDWLLEIKNIF